MNLLFSALVGDYIIALKTIFDFNFDLYQAVKPQEYLEVKRSCQLKKLLALNTYKFVRKKLANNKNF